MQFSNCGSHQAENRRNSLTVPTAKAFWVLLLALASFACRLPVEANERQELHGFVPPGTATSQPVGSLAGSQQLQLAIGLPLRNQAQLTNLIQRLYDPSSPDYRHFLTPAQFTDQFGPAEKDYQKVIRFAKSHGLAVTGLHPNRMLLDVNGSVTDIERALHLKMRTYRHPKDGRLFHAPDTERSIDLGVSILGITGLSDYSRPQPRLQIRPLLNANKAAPNAGSGPSGTFMGNDFRAAYAPDTALTGSGQAVGLVQFDGYYASDIAYYLNKAGLPSVTLSNVLVDGFNGNPSGYGGEVEVCLDIEMVASMAPGLSQVIVYMAGPYGNWHDILNRIATDDLAKQISCSWYSPGAGPDPVADQIFQQMAVQGQSFFDASGDDDAFTGLIDFPGDTPYLTQVGGTTLTTSGPGGNWVSERVWNWNNGIGSGGGISTAYEIPSWQASVSMTGNQGSTTRRNTPDVALTADNVYVRADGRDYDVAGTSCAAPLWAGFAALANQQAAASGRPAIGFVNPAVYAIGLGPVYNSCFRDITTGDNTSSSSPTKFYAVTGYDLCTGWGTPAGQNLINAIATPDPLLVAPGSGFASFGAMGGPFDVTTEDFVLTNSSTPSLNWSLINTSVWLQASPSGGTLAAGGPAVTVTVSLNAASSNLVAGAYSTSLCFTNLTTGVAQTRQFSLLVVPSNLPPVFVTQPADQSVFVGHTASFSINATGTPPLRIQWTFNNTNLDGATNTTLTLTHVQFSQAGDYAVLVTNPVSWAMSSNAFLTVNPLPPCTPQPAGLVSWWRGERNTLDLLGANNGVALGNLAYADGEVGQGFILNGVDAGVEVPANAALDVGKGSGLTVEGWINPTVIDVERPIVEWNNGVGGEGVHLWASTAATLGNGLGCLYANVVDNTGSWHTLASAGGLVVSNAFQHVALTYDKASGVGTLYLNGAVVAQQTLGTFTPQTSYDLYLGHRASGGAPAYWWKGMLDEMSLYGRALTTGEIQAIYTASYGGKCLSGVAPAIVTQPANETTSVGATAVFTVGASGSAPLSYQWLFNGTNTISGATDVSLVLTNVQLNQAGNYSVTVSNAYGMTNSANALLTVNPASPCTPPAAGLVGWWNGQGSTVDSAGTNNGVALGSLAYGTGKVGQGFSLNGVDAGVEVPPNAALDVGKGNGLTVEGWINPTVIDVERPIVEWNNGVGGEGVHLWASTAATLGNGLGCLYANVIDSTGSWHTLASAGGLVVSNAFQHVALTYDKVSGVGTLYLNGAVVAQRTLGAFTPQTSYDLYLGHRASGGAPAYWWKGMLDEISVYSRALTGTEIQAVYTAGSWGKCQDLPPWISVQPTNVTVVAGGNAHFNVSVGGTAPLHCQWLKNGSIVNDGGNVSGATTTTLNLTNVQDASAASYTIVVTNALGSITSSPAILTVLDPPVITQQPVSRTNIVGTSAGFSVTATGTMPMFYHWRKNGSILSDGESISGTTNATLVLANVQFSDAGNYSVTVSNAAGGIISSNASLTVNPSSSCVTVPSGLVGWWKGEGDTTDVLGANNGIALGSLAYAIGEMGQGFILNGVDAGVEVPANAALDVGKGSGLTVEGWINPTVIDVERPIVEWNNGAGSEGVHLWASTAPTLGNGLGCLYANVIDSTGSGHTFASAGGLVVSNAFQHVALTYDKVSGVGTLYLNGVVVAQQTLGVFIPQTSYDFYLGHRASGGAEAYWWVGKLDEISVYGRALTGGEIQAIHAAGAFGKCSIAVPPVITAQPTNQTALVGNAAVFSVGVSGSAPLSFRWLLNGTNPVDGGNSASLILTNVQLTQAGSYSVTISNTAGSVLSSNALLTVIPTSQLLPPPVGLLGWWRAEGNALDSAGTNDGVVVGGLGYAQGEAGVAFNLNGTDAGLRIPASPAVDLGQDGGLSIEGWINPTSVGVVQPIAEWNNGTNGVGLHLWITLGGGVGCLYANLTGSSDTTHQLWSPAGLVVSGVFQHVGLTYDKASGVAKLYRNGAVVAQQNLGSCTPGTSSYGCLGYAIRGGVFHGWAGMLDEISIYGRALTDAEMLTIYSAGALGKRPGSLPPWIVRQPLSQAVLSDSSAALTTVSSGTQPFSYQWKKNGVPLVDGSRVSGSTTATLVFNSFWPDDVGNYSVLVTNAVGSIQSSNAVLTIENGTSIVPWGGDSYGQTNVPIGLLDVAAIAAGPESYHGLALRDNHTVVAWGDNSWGQISVPVGLTNVVAVAAGGGHSLALKADGTVVGWGNNDQGQITIPAGLTNAAAISAGAFHSLAVKADGTVVAWGDDSFWESDVPPGLTNVVAVAGGFLHSLALSSDGTVTAWGDDSYGQTDVPVDLTNAVAISAGDSHNLALRSDGTVVGWGWDGEGETDIPAGLSNVIAIAAGYSHSLALKSDGTVVAWGWNDQGETNVPTGLRNVSAIAAGVGFSLALESAGQPTILKQPSNVNADPGSTVVFGVQAAGAAPLEYRWQKNGSILNDGGNVSGAWTAVLTLSNVQEADEASYTVLVTNVIASVVSSPATLTLLAPAPPAVTSAPASRTNAAGTAATFTVGVSGLRPLSFQWEKSGLALSDSGNISGAATASLTVTGVQDADAAAYSVVITNALGSVTSAPALLTVWDPPTITIQPASLTNDPGSTVSFTVETAGTPPFTYCWKKDGVALNDGGNVSGAGTATLTLTDVQISDAAAYTVAVTNAVGGVSSQPASLIVKSPPQITAQPASLACLSGATATFKVTAVGMLPLSYQWKKNNAYLADGGNVSGAATAILTLTNVQEADVAAYTVVITNALGSVTSAPAMLTLAYPPAITTQPANLTNVVGGTASFTVVVSGSSPLSYQWSKNGSTLINSSNVSGATSATLSLSRLQHSDAASYAVVVTNVAGRVASSPATLVVMDPVVILVQPVSRTNVAGTTATFSIVASNADYSGYQWRRNGANLVNGGNISGATRATLTLNPARPDNAGTYSVVVSNPYSTVLSSNATLTMQFARFIVPWGDDSNSQTNLPPGLADVAAIAAGPDSFHGLALRANHTVVAWGNNDWGQTNVPKGLTNVMAVAAGGGHSLALKADGKVVGWGNNDWGQMNIPTGLTNAVAIAAGATHSLAVKADGTMVAWGDDSLGQTDVPPGLTNVVAVSGGFWHSLALNADGTVVAWGDDSYGQTDVPADLTNAVAISAGDSHSLAVRRDGTVVGWGWDGEGETDIPAGLSNVVAVAAGYEHNLALKSDGTVVAWGWDGEGETDVPLALTNVMAIAAGIDFSIALEDEAQPVILKQPSGVSADQGAAVLLSVGAVGARPLSYQWLKNSSNLSDAGNVSGSVTAGLSLINVQDADTAGYSVIITNAAGSVTSSPAALTVLVPKLQLAQDGNTLTISWPTRPAGFVLESSASLSPANWAPVPCVPASSGDRLTVQIQMAETNCFYRLRRDQ